MYSYLILYYAWATIGVCLFWLFYRTEAFRGPPNDVERIEHAVRDCRFQDGKLQETIDILPLLADKVVAYQQTSKKKEATNGATNAFTLYYETSDQDVVSFDGKVLHIPPQITDTKQFVRTFIQHYIPCESIEIY